MEEFRLMKNFKDDSFEHFFQTNEYNQNKSVLKIVLWILIVIPFLLLGKLSDIFPFFNYRNLIISLVVFVVGYLSSFILFKIFPYSKLIKYLILFTIEIDVIILSLGNSSLLYIAYILVPLISCIYLDRKFSIKILIICYFLMILSLIYRALVVVPQFTSGISTKEWAFQYITFLSIEYFFNAFIVIIVSTRNSTIIDADYKGVVKEFTSQIEITSSYVAMLSQKQSSLERHVTMCSRYVQFICECLQKNKKYSDIFTQKVVFNYVTAAFLHDVGIISIPDSILHKKTNLTEKELSILKTHTILGNKLIKENMSEMDKDFLQTVCDMILYHHEQWDGNGYPYGIYENEIPLSGRVMAAANVLDNLLGGETYLRAKDFDEAMYKISQMEGSVLDPEIVKEILKNQNLIKQIPQVE